MASRARDQLTSQSVSTLVSDEELIPFEEDTFDLVLSNLSLHHINDVPGALAQYHQCLRPDGLFFGAFFGGDTLQELREILLAAEIETAGGASPHISPLANVRDVGALLQRTGFALPVVDTDTFTVDYTNPFDLFKDLRGMAQTNVLVERSKKPLRKETLFKAVELYQKRHQKSDGRIIASFEIIYATGWTPHESQQKPLRPGSGQTPLGEAIKASTKRRGS